MDYQFLASFFKLHKTLIISFIIVVAKFVKLLYF